MQRGKQLVIVLVLALGIAASAGVPAAAAPSVAPDRSGVFTNGAGSLAYQVHLPPSYRPGVAIPLLVAVHGCFMTGSGLNSMEDTSRLSDVADEHGFVVVYPSQSVLRNLQLCWNFDRAEHQVRDSGEPSLIAGMTRAVLDEYGLDPGRTYVAGASSGAAMAVVMGVTYPDLYAAIGVAAGCEYACDPAIRDDPTVTSPTETAERAYREMGPRARPVPAFVLQGTADTTVPPFVADRLVTHLAHLDDLAIDGLADGDVPAVPASVEQVSRPGEYPYTRSAYRARDSDTVLIETYVIDGLGHRWPGGGRGLFADPSGPNAADLLWQFLSTHSKPTSMPS